MLDLYLIFRDNATILYFRVYCITLIYYIIVFGNYAIPISVLHNYIIVQIIYMLVLRIILHIEMLLINDRIHTCWIYIYYTKVYQVCIMYIYRKSYILGQMSYVVRIPLYIIYLKVEVIRSMSYILWHIWNVGRCIV